MPATSGNRNPYRALPIQKWEIYPRQVEGMSLKNRATGGTCSQKKDHTLTWSGILRLWQPSKKKDQRMVGVSKGARHFNRGKDTKAKQQ